jgi:hypothetical protein
VSCSRGDAAHDLLIQVLIPNRGSTHLFRTNQSATNPMINANLPNDSFIFAAPVLEGPPAGMNARMSTADQKIIRFHKIF